MAIPSATVSKIISCHTCGSSICYMAQHQPVKNVVIPSATMAITSAIHMWLSICYSHNIINYLSCGFHSHNNKKVTIPSVTMAQIISHQNHMAITSANNISGYIHYDNNICHNQHKQVGLPCVNNKNGKNNNIWQTYPNSYCKD